MSLQRRPLASFWCLRRGARLLGTDVPWPAYLSCARATHIFQVHWSDCASRSAQCAVRSLGGVGAVRASSRVVGTPCTQRAHGTDAPLSRHVRGSPPVASRARFALQRASLPPSPPPWTSVHCVARVARAGAAGAGRQTLSPLVQNRSTCRHPKPKLPFVSPDSRSSSLAPCLAPRR